MRWGVGVLLATSGCLWSGPPPSSEVVVEINLPAQASSLAGSQPPVARLYHSEYQTAQLILATEPIATHRHMHSEETVYLISGTGVLSVDGADYRLATGDFVVVPRNTRHSFRPTGELPVKVLSIYAPAFIEGDRVFESSRD